MATFDQIQLQKLLAPFENNRGIVSTNNAVPMINNIPMIDTFSLYQKSQIPFIDQIIAANQNLVDTTPMDFINAPQDYYPTTGIVDLMPSTGGITELDLSRFKGVSDLGRDDEDVEQVEYLPGAKPKEGIARLFEVLGKIPTPFNLVRRGLESFRGLNQRIRQSDLGRSKNLMDYLDAKKYGGIDARNRAASKTMREARAIQKQLDLRTATGKYDDGGDRGRGQIPTRTTSAPKRSFSKSYSDAKSAFTAGR